MLVLQTRQAPDLHGDAQAAQAHDTQHETTRCLQAAELNMNQVLVLTSQNMPPKHAMPCWSTRGIAIMNRGVGVVLSSTGSRTG